MPDPEPEPTRGFYEELRGIAHRIFTSEREGHTLQPTAAVHEAFLRMMGSPLPDGPRSERLALATRVLRQVLIDHHRAHVADKRGGGAARVELDPELLGPHTEPLDHEELDAALVALEELHPRQAQVVTLRAYSDFSMERIATELGSSKRTVEGDWTVARAWLRRYLERKA